MKKTLIEPLAFRMPGASRFWPTRKLQSYIRQARVPMPERLETYNYLHRTPPDQVLESPFLDSIDVEGPLRQLRSVYNGTGATSMIDNMLALDWKFTLADNDLRKVVRMCDLAGVDVRFPFLDDELVEFSCSIPADLKIRGFTLRYFFKKAMQDFLPKAVLEKSKHGFGLPFGIWMKSNDRLRELAYDSINDFAGRGIVQPGYIDSLKEAHGSVHAHYYGEFIWLLMMLELWMKGLESRAGERIAA
jgi:asparagine synthase (glutamine-hydrolysing)